MLHPRVSSHDQVRYSHNFYIDSRRLCPRVTAQSQISVKGCLRAATINVGVRCYFLLDATVPAYQCVCSIWNFALDLLDRPVVKFGLES
ncbi:hypothetical protein VNO77_03198 [Canavalia gladiata]|uniref:Uncharacterized protein n=1 Tax=Canavalia gladiata TaxID=3824 RepID=A0AAN9MZ93_CANGL